MCSVLHLHNSVICHLKCLSQCDSRALKAMTANLLIIKLILLLCLDGRTCHLAKAAYCSRSSLSERMDSLASLTRCCNWTSSIIFQSLSLVVSGWVSSFCLSSSFFFLYKKNSHCSKMLDSIKKKTQFKSLMILQLTI